MTKPILSEWFEYDAHRYDIDWFEASRLDELPKVAWQQVYAVGQLDGRVPVVRYRNGVENLPGGRTEPGESIEQTLQREIEEELNCRVLNWSVLGYQRVTDHDKETRYQLRVWAELERIGPFVRDPDDSVIGHRLVELAELNDYIHYKNIGKRLIELARPYFYPNDRILGLGND